MDNGDETLTTKVLLVGAEQQQHISDLSKAKNRDLEISNAIHAGIHDIRSPLTVIKPYLGFLKRVNDKEQRDSILDRVNLSVNKIEAIISGLIEYTDLVLLDAPPIQLFSFEDLVKEVQFQLSASIADSEATILTDFSQVATISYPAGYLNKIIFHLLKNALSYKHPTRKPVIKISTQYINQKVILVFKDNGPGLKNEVVNKSDFVTPFTKQKHSSDSVGLGLAIVKAIVDKNDGFIHVQSSSQGTKVRLIFSVH